jgi:hypothetical protein
MFIEKYQNDIGEEFVHELIHFHKHVMSEVRGLQESDQKSLKVMVTMERI